MKNAALRHQHQQAQHRPEDSGTDETDGQAEPNDGPESLQATEDTRNDGYQYSEISSSKLATSTTTYAADPDDEEVVPHSFPKSNRRSKMLKKRQNLRQKLKSNLQLAGPDIVSSDAASSAAVDCMTVAASQEHSCSICGKTFATGSLLRKHSRFHIDRTIIPCAHCPALFERQWQYESHLVSAHGLAEQHACPDCERVFSHRSQLIGHMQTCHTKVSTLSLIILKNTE